jgi:membrane protein implicated in regulation of membrane protease activity
VTHRVHWAVWAVGAIGVALLIADPWAHALGVLPYLILLACPLVYFFMHGRHRHDSGHQQGAAEEE